MSLLTQLTDEGAAKNSWQRSRAWVVCVLGLGFAVALCAIAGAVSLEPSLHQAQAAGVDNLANLVQGRIGTGMQQPRLRSWLPSAPTVGAAPRMPTWDQLRNVQMSARRKSGRDSRDSGRPKIATKSSATQAHEPLISDEPTAAGPLSVLMLGYTANEVQQFKRTMADEFSADVPVIFGHEGMMSGTLRTALEMPWKNSRENSHEMADFIGSGLSSDFRRVVIISGVKPQKVSDVIDAYWDTELPRPVFAVAVPNNLDRKLASVVDELWAEDAAMRKRQRLERLVEPLPSAPFEAPWDSVFANVIDLLTVKPESRHQPRQVATAARRRPEKP